MESPKKFAPGQVWEKPSGRSVLNALMDNQYTLIHSLNDIQVLPKDNEYIPTSWKYVGTWNPTDVTPRNFGERR